MFEDGSYAMHAQVKLLAVANSTNVVMSIFVNSVLRVEGARFRTVAVEDITATVDVSGLLLKAGDVVYFAIKHDKGGGSYTYSNLSPMQNFANITRVS